MKPAQPGEFTFRAFLNGKMDLTQAEAVNDLIMARSTELLKAGENTLKGKLSTEIADLRDKVLNVLAFLQAAMDFPEDVEESSIAAQLEEILVETKELVKNARTAEVLRKGINLVIAGSLMWQIFFDERTSRNGALYRVTNSWDHQRLR